MAVLEGRLASLEDELTTIKTRQGRQPGDLTFAIHSAFIEGTEHTGEVGDFLTTLSSENSMDWRLAKSEMARVLCLHLIDSFFTSCCAYLPVFEPWHARLHFIRANIDTLDPASQALLGIAYPSLNDYPPTEEAIEAGTRRQKACVAITRHAHDLCHRQEIALTPSVLNLEALLVKMQMAIFEELVPRKSRYLLRVSLGHFKDLQDSPPAELDTLDSVIRLGLPIFLGDAITSAYARKPPLVTTEDLAYYFQAVGLHVPDFSTDNLGVILDQHIPRLASDGFISHETLVSSTTILACWLATAQREFAVLATYRSVPEPLFVLDQIHAAVQRVQQLLVNIAYLPSGCQSDGCADLHLRFDTRLDRDVMDVTYLLHSLIVEKAAASDIAGPEENTNVLLAESHRRVRKALKLVAFYSQLYLSSHDRHMVYHLAWQLELIPNWTTLVVQRWGEMPGPASADLEVTETELDWFERGLSVAAFYHPAAEARLRELERWRRPIRSTSEA
ncbi:hypothetical protein RQP46_000264 [Phenoliferia psychrophenolica]